MQLNQQITFFSDGGGTVRNQQLYLNPEAEHMLDWFDVTMSLTVLNQTAKGLPMTFDDEGQQYELREPTLKVLESVKWYLWHGNTYEALQHLETLEMDLDATIDDENKDATTHKLLRAVEEFYTYIANNQAFIPNYGKRYRQGDRISTGFVESAVNYVVAKRFTKRQKMQWSPKGAHLLLQMRTAGTQRRIGTNVSKLVSRLSGGER